MRHLATISSRAPRLPLPLILVAVAIALPLVLPIPLAAGEQAPTVGGRLLDAKWASSSC